MKELDQQQVITHHLYNSFLRNLTFNFSYLYVNSLLIAREGAQSFSRLFLWASMVSILAYVSFLFLRPRRISLIFSSLLALILVMSAIFYWSGETHSSLLYVVGVGIFLADLIGPNIATGNIQVTTHQLFFRDIYSRVILFDLRARIVASIVLLALNYLHLQQLIFPLFIGLLLLTLLSTLKVYTFLPLKLTKYKSRVIVSHCQEVVNSFLTNKFLFITVCIVIWATLCKFLIELILYQKLGSVYSNSQQLSSFMSFLNLGIIFASLFFQRFFAQKLLNFWTLTSLLYLLPAVAFVGAALSLTPLGIVGVVTLHSLFLIINKSIQIPTTRQCLLLVPERLKHCSIYVQSIFITCVGVLIGTFCQLVRDQWSYQHFIVLVVVVTTPIFFLVSKMDRHYISNIWRQLKQAGADVLNADFAMSVSGVSRFNTEKIKARTESSDEKTNIKYFIYELIQKQNTTKASHEDALLHAIKTYYESYDLEEIEKVVNWHQDLFESKKVSDVKMGLALCEILGLKCFDNFLENFAEENSDVSLKREVEIVLKSNRELSKYHFAKMSLESQFKFRYLFAKHMQRKDTNILKGLRTLIKNPEKENVSLFVDALIGRDFHSIRSQIEACLHNSYGRLSVLPLAFLFVEGDATQSKKALSILDSLSGTSFKPDVNAVLERFLSTAQTALPFEKTLKLLFLEEWCIDTHNRELRQSALAYTSLKSDEKVLFKELHLEFSKQSKYFKKLKPLILDFP